MFSLRPYQQRAVDAIYRHLRHRGHSPAAIIPPGGGCTFVAAQLAVDTVLRWGGRACVVCATEAGVRSLIGCLATSWPNVPVQPIGYGRRATKEATGVIVASAATIDMLHDFSQQLGHDLLIIDEAHLILRPDELAYRKLFAAARATNASMRVVALAASSLRIDGRPLCSEAFVDHVCCEIRPRELVRDGFLVPLDCRTAEILYDDRHVAIVGGEFRPSVPGSAYMAIEILNATARCRACLLYIDWLYPEPSVLDFLTERGASCALVGQHTNPRHHRDTLQRFRDGQLKYLAVSHAVVGLGDLSMVDGVVLLRRTLSPGRLACMVRQGWLPHPGKTKCLVLDFVGNLVRHGPPDQVTARRTPDVHDPPRGKACRKCRTVVPMTVDRCPTCRQKFPIATARRTSASSAAPTRVAVNDVHFAVHARKGASAYAPRTMRVDYQTGRRRTHSEWVCFEHEGFARQRAVEWWQRRSQLPVPCTAQEAVELATAGALSRTIAIMVAPASHERFERIVGHELDTSSAPALTGSES